MGLLDRAMNALGFRRDLASDAIGWWDRSGRRLNSNSSVNADSALRHSAVWACARLRADLISTMPVDVFRQVGDVMVEVTKPAWLTQPAPGVDITEWLWATQFDLDRYGNAFGLITAKDAQGRPASIELLSAGEVSVLTKGRQITGYRVGSEALDPSLIWHERQYRAAGSPLGLSPIAYAAMSISGYLSAQQFAADWYGSGAHPTGMLKNTKQSMDAAKAAELKARFKMAVENRDVFVAGAEYEWTAANADANSVAFLDEMQYGLNDICRFMGTPGDMIDAPSGGSSITYANITQRNLQLLIINLGPAITRRERAFSAAIANPRVVKLNTDAILRMDPMSRAQLDSLKIASRTLAPSEGRAKDNRAPFTEEQLAEFDRFWPAKQVNSAPAQERLGTHWMPPYGDMHVIQGWANDLPDSLARQPAAITSGWALPDERTTR